MTTDPWVRRKFNIVLRRDFGPCALTQGRELRSREKGRWAGAERRFDAEPLGSLPEASDDPVAPPAMPFAAATTLPADGTDGTVGLDDVDGVESRGTAGTEGAGTGGSSTGTVIGKVGVGTLGVGKPSASAAPAQQPAATRAVRTVADLTMR